jgi:hypothetical protein
MSDRPSIFNGMGAGQKLYYEKCLDNKNAEISRLKEELETVMFDRDNQLEIVKELQAELAHAKKLKPLLSE